MYFIILFCSARSVRPEKGFMGLALALFFLFLVSGMFAHAAACLAATLTEFTIRAGVFFEKNYFLHNSYCTPFQRLRVKWGMVLRE